MELVLNLVWLTLAAGALLAFLSGQRPSGRVERVPFRKSLVALAFVAVLLFPIVSASDDLHPTQAVIEEASKRGQLAVAPVYLARTSPLPPMLPPMLELCLVCAMLILQPFHPLTLTAQVLDGAIVLSAGRAPPCC